MAGCGRRLPVYGAAVSADQPGRPGGRPLAGATLDFLIGDWNVARQISDSASGRGGTFLGTATFRPDGPVVRYTEQGELTFGDHRGPASRELIYASRADGAADVRFRDGREFFRLDLGPGSCQAEHLCRADRYEVTVTRISPDSFTETWHVTGPGKDYELAARYQRSGRTSVPQAVWQASPAGNPGLPKESSD